MYRQTLLLFIFLLKANFTHAGLEKLDFFPIDATHQVTVNHVEDEWMIVLDDKSLWQALSLKKPKQTWYEWLFNITPKEWELEDGFFFDPKTWENAEIQVYKLNKKEFSGYDYLFCNLNTGEYAFTKLIPFGATLVPKLFFAELFFESPLNNSTLLKNKSYFENVIVLEDNSIWKIIPTPDKIRLFDRWLYNIKLDKPDAPFIFSLSSWDIDDIVQVYTYTEENNNDLKYGANQQNRSLYLIQNQSRNQLIYAEPVNLSELINLYDQLIITEYQRGYSIGYSLGYNSPGRVPGK